MRCKGGGRGEGARKPGRMEKGEGRGKEKVRRIKGGKEEQKEGRTVMMKGGGGGGSHFSVVMRWSPYSHCSLLGRIQGNLT